MPRRRVPMMNSVGRFARAVGVALVAVILGGPLASGATAEAVAPAPVGPPTSVTREVLVTVEPGESAAAAAARLGVTLLRTVPGRPDVAVVGAPRGGEAALAARLRRSGSVVDAVPNPIARMAAVPSDRYFSYQWHLQPRSTYAGGANWTPIWENGATGAGVTVAVLDTGVSAHADLDGVAAGRDFIDGDLDAADQNGHGTHIAGTVAETTGNGLGAAGIAPDATVLPVRVLDAEGVGSYDQIIAGLEYATNRGADIVNLSFAGHTDGGLCDAVDRAFSRGVVVIAAAGNDGGPVSYPAACANAIGVGAVNLSGALASYANRGPEIDIAAPGGEPRGDLNRDGFPDGILQYTVMNNEPGYYFIAGTSMASPHVAGAAALMLQAVPSMTPAQVRSALVQSAVDLGSPGLDESFGAGLLDITASLSAARAAAQPAPQPAPEPQPAPQPSPQPPPADSGTARRVSGADRFATAAAVSAASWPSGAERVFLATGLDYADALATGALAGRWGGPLLLTSPCSMPGSTGEELKRLRPRLVTVIGGPRAVCDTLLDQARTLTGAAVDRLAGTDRYDTAVRISQAAWGQGSPVVYVASGAGFADGLGGGALAAHGGGPLLLTAPCSVPQSTRDEVRRLGPSRVVVLGGAGAVCDGVLAELGVGGHVMRLAGEDRFATSATASVEGWTTSPKVYVVGGGGFADGLAAGPPAALDGAPLLLVPSCGAMPSSIGDALRRLQPTTITVVGGGTAVCDDMLRQLGAAVPSRT